MPDANRVRNLENATTRYSRRPFATWDLRRDERETESISEREAEKEEASEKDGAQRAEDRWFAYACSARRACTHAD